MFTMELSKEKMVKTRSDNVLMTGENFIQEMRWILCISNKELENSIKSVWYKVNAHLTSHLISCERISFAINSKSRGLQKFLFLLSEIILNFSKYISDPRISNLFISHPIPKQTTYCLLKSIYLIN